MLSFEELYRDHAASVFRFALYLSGNRADAEDIASETFVRAWTADTPIRAPSARAYLLTIARHLFLNQRRQTAHHVELNDDLADSSVSPQEAAAQRGEFQSVARRLQTLPEIDRSALLMRALDDMPYEEIAQMLGLSVSNTKVKVHRARAALMDIRGRLP